MRAGIRRAAVLVATGMAATALMTVPANADGVNPEPESEGLLGQILSIGGLRDIGNMVDEVVDSVANVNDKTAEEVAAEEAAAEEQGAADAQPATVN
ncbi:hypothetical protein G5C51_11470 [Streptomyces sp. A7024]|uniref:Secreted protein n=1 Tax=Streptomyces coryli TaxID=1128680 RepID=A0A6G4TWZ1_9ACTN|nr:hypothetical protein [Streptomyces coryli]NGN64519.1 hypothetical protein [Streptomyces coryli]